MSRLNGMPISAIVLSAIAAIAIQPFIYFVWNILLNILMGNNLADLFWYTSLGQVRSITLMILYFSSPFVFFLGIPLFLFIYRCYKLNAKNIGILGFLSGLIPNAIYSWPLSTYSGVSSGGGWYGGYVDFYINGKPTVYGWLSYIQGSLQMGIHGLLGALIFLYMWRKLNLNESYSK